jgi:hypothetical protein
MQEISMNKKPTKQLANLPTEFVSLLNHTINQIRSFGDAIILTEFSFLSIKVLFLPDFSDGPKNIQASLSRNLIYTAFDSNRKYVDEKIKMLENNDEEYLKGIYALGLVYLWTSLESFVKRLIAALINFDKEILSAESFRKLNIPMSEFFHLKDDEK